MAIEGALHRRRGADCTLEARPDQACLVCGLTRDWHAQRVAEGHSLSWRRMHRLQCGVVVEPAQVLQTNKVMASACHA